MRSSMIVALQGFPLWRRPRHGRTCLRERIRPACGDRPTDQVLGAGVACGRVQEVNAAVKRRFQHTGGVGHIAAAELLALDLGQTETEARHLESNLTKASCLHLSCPPTGVL